MGQSGGSLKLLLLLLLLLLLDSSLAAECMDIVISVCSTCLSDGQRDRDRDRVSAALLAWVPIKGKFQQRPASCSPSGLFRPVSHPVNCRQFVVLFIRTMK